MKKNVSPIIARTGIGLFTAAFLVVSFGAASVIGPLPEVATRSLVFNSRATGTLLELNHLGLMQQADQTVLEDLLAFQAQTGQSLADILRNSMWTNRLGLVSDSFKATWYAANPFDLLPRDLQVAIRRTHVPFQTQAQVKQWCQLIHAPDSWKRALDLALVETTPVNLWRASRGKQPYAKNGQYLQSIVVEKDRGKFEVRDGHIATDPSIIPTNSRVLLLVKVNGEYKIIRAKATDIGGAIRGRHVDLPITIKPGAARDNHSIRFPGEYIRNPDVIILHLDKKINPGRKA